MNARRFEFPALAAALFVSGLLIATTPGYATEQGDQRKDARDTRQDTKQEARKEKVDCKAANQKNNAECRKDKRDTKQGGREEARDIKKQ